MSQLSYQDILDMWNNTSSILQDAGEDKQEYAADLLSSYQSEKTLTLLRVGLTGDAIQNLLFPNGKINTSLIELFWEERMNSIYQMAQKPDFDWKILRFQEVCMLYGLLLPTSKIPEIDWLWHISHNLKSFTGTGEVWNTLQWYTQISSSLMTGLSGLWLTLTKDEFISPDKDTDFMNQVRSHIPDWANKNNDIEVLSRIVALKNNIISDGTENGFLSHPKLQLSPEQKKIIQENIGYTQVLALFSTLDGNSDLSSMNALSLPAVLYIISDILWNNGTENAFSSTQYLWNYLRKVLFWEMDANILSQDEKDVLGIYGEKAIELVYASYMQQYLSILWFSGWLTDVDLNQLALSSFIGWFALNTWGSFLVKSGIKNGKISIPGTFLKKIGWIGMILGPATWAVSFYTQSWNTWKFERDLQSSVENGDMEKFISLLKTHKESIKRYTTPNGKEVVALTFPWEPPFYVIDWIVYWIQAGRLDWDERIKNISQHEQWIWQWIIEYWSSVVWDGTWKVDGVDYTTQRFENEHIIFWTWDKTHTIAISQLLWLFETQPGKVGQDILSKITNGETVLPYGLWNEGIEWYPLAQLWNNDMLFLAKIWTIDQMFQT